MEDKKVLEEEKLNTPLEINLLSFSAVQRFKSVRRAIKRGLVSPSGAIYPNRPFNNSRFTRRTDKKNLNDIKKIIYANIKHRK